ncbi:MAG: OadG family transporter subunit [Spirochaetales bacterium]
MIDGLTITIVGMLTVFAFLVVLVAATAILRGVAERLSGSSSEVVDTREVAASIASIHHRIRGQNHR